jgi:hypothetical protein
MAGSLRLLGGAVCFAAAPGGQAYAQVVQQSVALTQVDPASRATGYRTSKAAASLASAPDMLSCPTADLQ